MSGEADYQLRVVVASLKEFEDFLRQDLTKIPGVSQVTTSFALRPVITKSALPI
jgi:Lrp/AsnC family leucine-responsive transcriptional regulator